MNVTCFVAVWQMFDMTVHVMVVHCDTFVWFMLHLRFQCFWFFFHLFTNIFGLSYFSFPQKCAVARWYFHMIDIFVCFIARVFLTCRLEFGEQWRLVCLFCPCIAIQDLGAELRQNLSLKVGDGLL